jgi:hypothetical protein
MIDNAVTPTIPIHSGETNLIRVISAALNQPLFFTIANHKLTVVGADASYLKPFTTNILMLGPGQTTDVLITKVLNCGRGHGRGCVKDFTISAITAVALRITFAAL